jgi:hypothetical protein
MKYTITLFILLFLNSTLGIAQLNPTKNLKGKIISPTQDLEGVYIYNQTKKNAVISEKDGFFEITVSIGDTLLVSSVQFKKNKFVISKKEYESNLLYVEMEVYTAQLAEVEVNQFKNLNAVSLGILSKPAKTYTPAERRLYTASAMSVGSIITLDPLLNWLSGRTKSLKMGVAIERNQFALDKINYLFEDKYFVETLKIPEDYIEGFKYYIIEDAAIRDALNNKNKTMAKFLMSSLSIEYLKNINSKN